MKTIMTRDELEFSITQYLDGTLDEPGRRSLEARLAADAEARVLLEEHRTLITLLRSSPIPEVRWEKLSESISVAIDERAEERAAPPASWVLRLRAPAFLAAAASVVLAGGIAFHFLFGPRPNTPAGPTIQPQATVALDVQGPGEDQPTGPSVEEVSIGPGGSYAHASSLAPYADEIDTRPTRVVVAAGVPVTAEDSQQPSPF